jgi:hypothetical protein
MAKKLFRTMAICVAICVSARERWRKEIEIKETEKES